MTRPRHAAEPGDPGQTTPPPAAAGAHAAGAADAGASADEAPATPRATWKDGPGLAVRGGLVGAAESVPGISGGTIALVVGLYDRLIGSASALIHAAREVVSGLRRGEGLGPARVAVRAVDWRFLAPVLAGMVVVLLASLMTIAPLLEEHPVPVRSVFFGMILISIWVPISLMPHRFRPQDGLYLLLAAAAAFWLTGLPEAEVGAEPPLWLVFLGAAIAINALVLPGVSGSFVLLVLGLYLPVRNAISDLDVVFVLVFALGALIGLASFVKLLNWLLHHRRQVTMAVLAGLMTGSLRALWPWQEGATLTGPNGPGEVVTAVLLALAGAAVVGGLLWWEHRNTVRAARKA